MSKYIQDPLAQLAPSLNGLTLVQINPDMAVDLKSKSEDFGWLFSKENDSWTKVRKLDPQEIDQAWDQVADMVILDASKIDPPKEKKGWKSLFKR